MKIPYCKVTEGLGVRLYVSWLEKSAENPKPIQRHVFSAFVTQENEQFVRADFAILVQRNMNRRGVFMKWWSQRQPANNVS